MQEPLVFILGRGLIVVIETHEVSLVLFSADLLQLLDVTLRPFIRPVASGLGCIVAVFYLLEVRLILTCYCVVQVVYMAFPCLV